MTREVSVPRTIALAAALAVSVVARGPGARWPGWLSALDLPTSGLEVRTTVSARRVSIRRGDSVIVEITARNPRWWPARVDLGGPGYGLSADSGATRGIGFAYRLTTRDGRPAGPAAGQWGNQAVWFGPGMTRRCRFVFDLAWPPAPPHGSPMHQVGVWYTPGQYLVHGGFATNVAPAVPLEVLP